MNIQLIKNIYRNICIEGPKYLKRELITSPDRAISEIIQHKSVSKLTYGC